MSDEEEFDVTAAMAEDEGGGADEPAISPDELMEIADAPERWDDSGEPIHEGPKATGEERAQHAADSAAAAAAQGPAKVDE